MQKYEKVKKILVLMFKTLTTRFILINVLAKDLIFSLFFVSLKVLGLSANKYYKLHIKENKRNSLYPRHLFLSP
jgi:hypothetical protein